MMYSRISLDQWRAFVSTVDTGGFAPAAEHLNKSQSAISHAISKMESLLGQDLFVLEGRKAVLTPLGQSILPQAKHLLNIASKLETTASQFDPEVQAEIAVAIDMTVPTQIVFDAFEKFEAYYPQHRIRFYETSLSGSYELLMDGLVELAIGMEMPPEHSNQFFCTAKLICVAHKNHAIWQQNKHIFGFDDLRSHRQIVLRNSAMRQDKTIGWLGSPRRWTVTHFATAKDLIEQTLGYAWMPYYMVADELKNGTFKQIMLEQLSERFNSMYVGAPESLSEHPETQCMIQLLKDCSESFYKTHKHY